MVVDWNSIIAVGSSLVSAGGASFITHLIDKGKYTAEVENMRIHNDEDKFKFYTDLVDDLTKRVKVVMTDLEGMEKKYNEIYYQNTELIRQNRELSDKNALLVEQNAKLLAQNEELVKDNAELKRSLKRVLNSPKKDSNK